MLNRIITYSFYLLFFLTPLIFTPYNSELFEYNKMTFVYILTVIITLSWLIKMINHKSLIINRTPLDIPLMLFLGSQILSTIFSIDPHTSIWGYYSRSNGGLLSIISYLLLYYAFVSNFHAQDVIKFLKAVLLGGFLVALYAIPEHFGVSPSCIILVQRASVDCWVQDVQARVFATLGQPNWLAAYLSMLIFPALYFFLQAKTRVQLVTYFLLLVTFYLAFTFTYSRGATLGLLAGLGIFIIGYGICHLERSERSLGSKILRFLTSFGMTKSRPLLLILTTFLIINLLFGSSLTGDFRLIKQFAPPAREAITTAASGGTQLETGGTESGKIRLIVWQGALEIFKHYPIFGSGVETFAYSYYNFRPLSHNLVSEWDFLYNKAHNEYLNYLATTGLVGFLSYMAVILTFIMWCIRYYVSSIKQGSHNSYFIILNSSLIASYISYLVQNFFLFSVVIIALFFYLFPAFAFLASDSTKPIQLPKFLTFIYNRPFYTHLTKLLLTLAAIYILSMLGRFWIADTFFKNGSDYSESGNPGRAYNFLSSAVRLNSGEPLYRNELGFAAAQAALALEADDATTSAALTQEAQQQTKKSLEDSPKNISLLRTAIRSYYLLSALDPKFEDETIKTIDSTISLAPTDAKLYYNKGLILSQMGKIDEAIEALERAINLKPDYNEATQLLEELGNK